MKDRKIKLKKYVESLDKWDIGLLAVCLGFYLFFPFYDGPVWCKDSLSYTSMNITREPLYPTFLLLFRKMFGEENYLFPVVFVQSVIAAYAAWKLAVTVKRYQDNNNILAVLAVCFQFGVTILCRFVAIRGSSYIDSIMTEGIGLSLYVLFIVQLYLYVMEKRTANLVGMSFFAVFLVNLRKQMMITFCLMAAVFILYYLIKSRYIKKLILLLFLVAGLLFTSKMTDRLYNYFVRGAWIEHSGNSMGMLCTLIYTAEEEDAELIEDEALKEMFLSVWHKADEQKLNISYAPSGWVDFSSYYADCYDAIGYGIINPVVQGYIGENYDYSQAETETLAEVETMLQYDEYCSSMSKALLSQDKGDIIEVFASNAAKGFVNSIARMNTVLNVYAVIAYVLYLGLYFYLVKRKGFCKEDKTLAFAEIVLGGVIVNSLVVGAMIFCQPRYMIYNMGLFYCALSVLLYDCFKKKSASRSDVL